MARKLEIDLRRCSKSGECYYNHPDLFAVGKDGYPHALVPVVTAGREKLEAEQAIEVCPAQAISLVEE